MPATLAAGPGSRSKTGRSKRRTVPSETFELPETHMQDTPAVGQAVQTVLDACTPGDGGKERCCVHGPGRPRRLPRRAGVGKADRGACRARSGTGPGTSPAVDAVGHAS